MKLTDFLKIQNIKLQGDVSSWMFYVMIILVISMPLSEFGMSISQIALLILWMHEGAVDHEPVSSINSSLKKYFVTLLNNFKHKIQICYNNKMLLLFVAIYLLHIVGLLYTSDYKFALKDLRVKLPILILPLIFASIKFIDTKKLFTLLCFFIGSVVIGTFVGIYVKLNGNISDTREMSIFISHIRFALMICFSIFIITFFLIKKIYQGKFNIYLLTTILLWLVIYLFISKALTGIILFFLVSFILITIYLLHNKKLLYVSIGLIIVFTLGSCYYIHSIIKDLTIAKPVEISKLDQVTRCGNLYLHDTLNYGIESGSHVGLYISESELEEAWNNKSAKNYRGLDNKGQQLRTTIIRYLHSRGLRKDAEGLNQLKLSEIKEIENGVANVNYLKSISIHSSIAQLLQGYFTYKKFNNPNASSLMQRIEYWKTSYFLIKNKPLLGYGTGDLDNSFKQAYKITNSNLSIEYQHRSHNQFLAMFIALGLPGILLFLIGLVYPPFKLKKFDNYIFVVFFMIIIFSMLTEDTLETQPGVTFFAFFNALLLFGLTKEADIICSIRNRAKFASP